MYSIVVFVAMIVCSFGERAGERDDFSWEAPPPCCQFVVCPSVSDWGNVMQGWSGITQGYLDVNLFHLVVDLAWLMPPVLLPFYLDIMMCTSYVFSGGYSDKYFCPSISSW